MLYGEDHAVALKAHHLSGFKVYDHRKRLADECGGELIIKSAPDEGTECTILIPKELRNEDLGN